MKIYKQETEKSCGVACLRSIINHFGNDFSEKDIWEKHKPFQPKKGGILNPIMNLGVTASKFGFEVTYMGYNPIITNNNSSSDLKSL
jgi:ABC-type bacteriocin/lantibiotic exporter with double-glycine peptidase domain